MSKSEESSESVEAKVILITDVHLEQSLASTKASLSQQEYNRFSGYFNAFKDPSRKDKVGTRQVSR